MKRLYFILIICFFCFSICSFYYYHKKNLQSLNLSRDIVLAFITYNGYGNNLYIDNVLTGQQADYDVTPTSILNISYDTTYSTLSGGTDTISPLISVSNIGRNNVPDTIQAYLRIDPGMYLDSVRIPSLNSGQTIVVGFKKFTYSIGTGYYFKSYTSYTDSNRINDTLFQYSIKLPGFKRNVLFEEFTSYFSPAAANNNPALNFFVNSNIQTVTAIKYHSGILGNDTFYTVNPEQSDARRRYYYVSAIPTTIVDGKLFVSIPYGDSVNLYTPYLRRLSKGTPLSMNVVDERVSGDSIKTTISVNIISNLPQGNYKLKINAVERYIYDSLTGTQGEEEFYDVFRQTYPDTNGISISTAIGNHQYQYTYYRNPEWVDSMIYTAAFIQNDNTREVINCAKGRNIVLNNLKKPSEIIYEKSDLGKFGKVLLKKPEVSISDSIQTFLNVELFEAFFPPLGWRVFNEDGYITFEQFTGANGPSLGGSKAVIMDFFDYNIPGQKDSMYSKIYINLLSIDTVRFDYAYAQYNSTNIDSLIVKISNDGGLTFPIEIFRKGGLALATAPQTTTFFIPTNNTQWRTYSFPLADIVSINNLSLNIPTRFQLKQNYPNPFNPTTTINYELPVSNEVKLIIYDILGKEIKTLVNEKQNAGNYQVIFDGTNFPSGIYFYQLITEAFSDTKRMILIK